MKIKTILGRLGMIACFLALSVASIPQSRAAPVAAVTVLGYGHAARIESPAIPQVDRASEWFASYPLRSLGMQNSAIITQRSNERFSILDSEKEKQMSRLTLNQMQAAIKDGGSVLYQGRIITKLEDLPAEEELAQSEPERQAVADDLRSQMEALQRRLATLEGGQAVSSSESTETSSATNETPAETTDPAKDKSPKAPKNDPAPPASTPQQ